MANVKISELDSITSGSINLNNDVIPMVSVDTTTTKKVTIKDLKVVLNQLGNSIGEGNSYGEDLHGFSVSGYSSNIISLSGYSFGYVNTAQITPQGTDLTSYLDEGSKISVGLEMSQLNNTKYYNNDLLRPIEIIGSNFAGGITYLTASLPEGVSFSSPGSGGVNILGYRVYKTSEDNFDRLNSLSTMIGFSNIIGGGKSSSNLVVGSLNNTNNSIYSTFIGIGTEGSSSIASLAVGNNSYVNAVGCCHIGRGAGLVGRNSSLWSDPGNGIGGAIGDYSLAVGDNTKAVGFASISLGQQSLASGSNSVSLGYYNGAIGDSSAAIGRGILTNGVAQIGVGKYNAVGDEDYGIFIVGNGTSINSRSNALRVSGSGDIFAEGTFINGGADYAEFFESVDGTAIPNGTVVELVNGKVQPCIDASDAIGVISSNPNVLGNAEGEGSSWVNKYQKDVWGNKIYGNYEVTEIEYTVDGNKEIQEQEVIKTVYGPLINPDYDPSLPYIPRENRPEWNKVGLLGQLKVLKNQPIPAYWKFMKDINDDIALYLVK